MDPLAPIESTGPANPSGPTKATEPPRLDGARTIKPTDSKRTVPPTGDARFERVFLTATEVGQQLGIRKSRVYELAAAGLLPVVRLGRRMRFPRRGLEEMAAATIERAKAEVLGPAGHDRYAEHGSNDAAATIHGTGAKHR